MSDDLEFASKELENEKCPNCGSNLAFDPASQRLKCDHCGYIKSIESEIVEEQSFNDLLKPKDDWSEQFKPFSCKNCGAEVLFEKANISKTCPYCGTASVVESKLLSGPIPNGVVPFNLSKEQAINCYLDFIKRKFYALGSFKTKSGVDNVDGIFNPCYTFDSTTFTQYSGILEKTTTATNSKGNSSTKTVRFNISGQYNLLFDDYLVEASHTVGEKNLSKIKPFNTHQAKEYKESYLLGYKANSGVISGVECWAIAKRGMENVIRSKVLQKYSYTRVVSYNQSVVHKNISNKYLLLPLYIGCKRYKEKPYNFFINGSTGKLTAKYPLSVLKIILSIIIGAGLIIGLYLVIDKFFLSSETILQIFKTFKGGK